jgi:peptidoglycan hydrolase-like protein with peptidoglycan-binding domain
MRHVSLIALLALGACSWMGSSSPPAPAPASVARPAPMDSGVPASSHQGADIRAVQEKLGVNADGVWGPASARATRDYQNANGLPVTGVADNDTLVKMGLAQPPAMESRPACEYQARRTDGSCP